eukprot:scaffold1245_cov88-Skeletonema_marinoi.AAC.1
MNFPTLQVPSATYGMVYSPQTPTPPDNSSALSTAIKMWLPFPMTLAPVTLGIANTSGHDHEAS